MNIINTELKTANAQKFNEKKNVQNQTTMIT